MDEPTKQVQGKTLSAFLRQVTDLVKTEVRDEWITAEISAASAAKPGAHLYLDLVEHDANGMEVAKAKANLWASSRDKLVDKFQKETGATLRAGIKVMLYVSAGFHPQYGFSMVIKDINPTFTVGDMQKKLMQIRAALTASGVIGKNKSLKTPAEFTRVAVVAPSEAAGLGDFKSQADILAAAGLCAFDYFHARFQGTGAADEVVGAMNKAWFRNFEMGNDRYYDALVIIRGGGAASDLAYLNEFGLADAICRAPIPVMIGVGHERDKVILDEVATYSAHTPSKLIGFISETIINNAQANIRHWQYIVAFAGRVTAVSTELLAGHMQHVKSRSVSLLDKAAAKTLSDIDFVKSNALSSLKNTEQKMDNALSTIRLSTNHVVNNAQREVENTFSTIIGLGPQKTLERGFAIARSGGKPVTRKAQALAAETIELQFSDGSVTLQPISKP